MVAHEQEADIRFLLEIPTDSQVANSSVLCHTNYKSGSAVSAYLSLVVMASFSYTDYTKKAIGIVT